MTEHQDPAAGGDRPFVALERVLGKLVDERRQAAEVFDAMQQETYMIRGGGIGIRLVSTDGGRYEYEYVATPLDASMYEDEQSASRVADFLAEQHEEIASIDVVTVREATQEAVSVVRETIDRLVRFGVLSAEERGDLVQMDSDTPTTDLFIPPDDLIIKRHQAKMCAISSRTSTDRDAASIH